MTGPTVPRRLELAPDLRHRSVFLFGPRQTGKTTYLSALFPRSPVFNLLRGEVFLRLSREPGRLRQELGTVSRSSEPVIIDEIQKLPSLLDEVHDLIESRGLQFIVAASSPAKVRRGGVNLLGGRARLGYSRDARPLTFWRTTDGSEVDFVVGDSVAIEVKATGAVAPRDLTGLRRLAEEVPLHRRIVVCSESAPRIVDGIELLPVVGFLAALWAGEILD